MNDKVLISASLACADFGCLGKTIKELEQAGIAMFHFDVVDGSFAPTFIMGPPVIASLRKYTKLPFEAHLACWHPEQYVGQFIASGVDYLAYHLEATGDPLSVAKMVREKGAKPVLALRPETPAEAVSDALLKMVDMVLILTVNPGFAGQQFIPKVLEKIDLLFRRIQAYALPCSIEADGNICETTIPLVVRAGARVLIGGSSGLFRMDRSLHESVSDMKWAARNALQKGREKD
ncbi:MAG: ribulose-phosphate 3-epimerase [Atribacterota bacterium]